MFESFNKTLLTNQALPWAIYFEAPLTHASHPKQGGGVSNRPLLNSMPSAIPSLRWCPPTLVPGSASWDRLAGGSSAQVSLAQPYWLSVSGAIPSETDQLWHIQRSPGWVINKETMWPERLSWSPIKGRPSDEAILVPGAKSGWGQKGPVEWLPLWDQPTHRTERKKQFTCRVVAM